MRANSWILHDLPKKIISDWYSLQIYSEYDLQVAAYYWIRRHYDSKRSEKWIVRAQPHLRFEQSHNQKPDIVIYNNTLPYDVFELKCQMNGYESGPVQKDLIKLQEIKDEWNIRHAYLFLLYDDERQIKLTKERPEWATQYLTFLSVNVRRDSNGRKRRNYDEIRKKWERFK